jgi:hypothetical protein
MKAEPTAMGSQSETRNQISPQPPLKKGGLLSFPGSTWECSSRGSGSRLLRRQSLKQWVLSRRLGTRYPPNPPFLRGAFHSLEIHWLTVAKNSSDRKATDRVNQAKQSLEKAKYQVGGQLLFACSQMVHSPFP